MSTSNASCQLDPIPTSLVKNCSDVLIPVVTKMVNMSLEDGVVPDKWKIGLVLPLLKRQNLDLEFCNFTPVSNLPFVSKITEKFVLSDILNHCSINFLMPSHQSSYQKFHSTETALLKVPNDILSNMDQQKITLLVLLDLSVAFDTIDQTVVLETLESDFGVVGNAQNWIASFLLGRKQHVAIDHVQSEGCSLTSGVPQGSYLLFLFYASGIFKIVLKPLPSTHAFADDTQLYLSFKPTSSDVIRVMEECIAEVRAWLIGHKL